MKCAIMQPYFFPYIGYWQLISSVDVFVIYDDVNYIKQGYINRNSILCQGKEQRITLEVLGGSSNKYIYQVLVGNNRNKLLKTISQCYKKSPMYSNFYPVLEDIFNCQEKQLSMFLGNSIKIISDYIGLETQIIYSTKIEKNSNLKAENKILEICKNLNCNMYINAIGGQELYDKRTFQARGLELKFLQSKVSKYTQLSPLFIANLSIIDILMNNSVDSLSKLLNNYELI